MNQDLDLILQEILCGDRAADDAEVRRLVRTQPEFARRLAAMQEAERRLAALAGDDRSSDDEVASLIASDDRSMVDAALRPPVRTQRAPRRALLAAAAVALLAVGVVMVVAPPVAPPTDGRLGGASDGAVQAHADDGRWVVRVQETLPPGTRYHLRLELPDGGVVDAHADAPQWTFPDEWNQALARTVGATLVVSWDDGTGLVVRRSLRLR